MKDLKFEKIGTVLSKEEKAVLMGGLQILRGDTFGSDTATNSGDSNTTTIIFVPGDTGGNSNGTQTHNDSFAVNPPPRGGGNPTG